MKGTIEVTVEPTGAVKIDALGFKGADCEAATRYLEEALGVVSKKERKPEYHQRRAVTHQQKLGA
jgi:hypothetical protein